MTNPLRYLPTAIVRGAVALPDGSAVGLVCGGTPVLELLTAADQRVLVQAYRQILLSLQTPLHVYQVDQPLDLRDAVAALLDAQGKTTQPTQARILGELADRLARATLTSTTATKQVVWAVSVAAPALGRLGWSVRGTPQHATNGRGTVLEHAAEQARQLADKLAALGGQPAPYLPFPEAIAQLWYRQIDPIRASHYPLSGELLERLDHAITRPDQGATQ